MSTQSSSSFGQPSQRGTAHQNSVGDGPVLSERDAAAVDHVLGNDSAGASDRDRNERVAALLGLLDLSSTDVGVNRELVIDLTLARVSRASRERLGDRGVASFVDGDLAPEDDDALEALVEAGMEISRVPASLRRRASRQLALLDMLTGPVPETAARESLVARTLAGVQESIEREESRLEVAAVGGIGDEVDARGWRPRFRIGDLVTVAAMVLIGFGVLAPITSAVQGYSQKTNCQANLSAAGLGFGLYAGSNKDVLPMASSSPVGRVWWSVGKNTEESNAANLYMLVRSGATHLEDLACAGNVHAVRDQSRGDAQDWSRIEEVSYSYQNLFARERPRWSGARTIVLVDRSPVVLKAYQRQLIDPLENSPNHAGKGQAALWNDGSVDWLRSPVLRSGDNIWLPREIERAIRELTRPRSAEPIKGTESPEGADDVFVGP